MVNVQKLSDELTAAQIHFFGIHSDGRVWDENGDIQDRPDVAAVIMAHDPSETPAPTIEERLQAAELIISMLAEA